MDLIPRQRGPDPVHGPRDPQIRRPGLPGPPGIFHLAGRDDLVVATVEGRPRVEEVLPLVTAPRRGAGAADAGGRGSRPPRHGGEGPDSWKRLLQSRGHAVSCRLTGLGPCPRYRPLCPPPGGASGRVLREETCRGKGAADAGALHHCGREAPALRTHHRDLPAMAAAGRCGCPSQGGPRT